MDKVLPTAIIVAVILLALIGMYFGWRARVRRHGSVPAPDAVPASFGDPLFQDSGLYVATTVAGQPWERVAAHGLGFRARAHVTLTESGIVVELTGRSPFFVSRSSIVSLGSGTWAIDKAVEPGGLVVLTWRLGDTELDSYFRMDDGPQRLLDAEADLEEGLA